MEPAGPPGLPRCGWPRWGPRFSNPPTGGGPPRFPPAYPFAEPSHPLTEPTYPDSESTYADPESTYPEPEFSYPQPEAPYPLPESPYPLAESPYPLPDVTYPLPEEDGASGAGEDGSGSSPPQFSFHLGDPDDVMATR